MKTDTINLIENDLKNPLTSKEALILRSKIELEKLKKELKEVKQKPLLVRIVSVYMQGLRDWINWMLENDKMFIQLKKEERYKMKTDNFSAQDYVERCNDREDDILDLIGLERTPFTDF